jgi:hypothetical protein
VAKPATLGLYSKESFIIVYHRRHRRRHRQNHDIGSLVVCGRRGFREERYTEVSQGKAAPPEAYCTSWLPPHLPRLMSTSTHSCPNQQTLVQISSLCRVVVLLVTRCDGGNFSTTHEPTISINYGGRSQTDPEVRAILLLDLHLLSFGLRLQHYHLGSMG